MTQKGQNKDVRTRFWAVTQPAEGEHGLSRQELEKALERYEFIGQEEIGDSGYRHYQMIVAAKPGSTIRFSTMKNALPKAHLEPARDPKALRDYCTKTKTRVPNTAPLVKGDNWDNIPSSKGQRTDLETIQARIMESDISLVDLYCEFPRAAQFSRMCESLIAARDAKKWGKKLRKVEVTAIFGATGTGKTSWVYDTFDPDDVCRVSHYQNGNLDGYNGEKILVLDEYTGQIPIEQLLTMLDIFPTRLACRYSDKQARYEQVVLLSNIAPWLWYPDAPVEQREALNRRLSNVYEQLAPGERVEIPCDEKLAHFQ